MTTPVVEFEIDKAAAGDRAEIISALARCLLSADRRRRERNKEQEDGSESSAN